MNLFFDIPKVLQVGLLARWLEPVDAAYLDSATASHKYRNELLDLLSSPECILGCMDLNHMDTTDLVVTRHVKPFKICVRNTYLGDGTMLEKLLRTVGPTLKNLLYELSSLPAYWYNDESVTQQDLGTVSAKNLIRAFSHHCKGLESLIFCDGELERDVPALIFANYNSLTHIRVTDCHGINVNHMESVYNIPGLKKVEMEDCFFSTEMITYEAPVNTSCISLMWLSSPIVHMIIAFPNLRELTVSLVQSQDLVLISVHCLLLEHVHADLLDKLSLEQAIVITESWQPIKELHLCVETYQYLCDENVVLQLISKCLGLKYLTLFPSYNMVTAFKYSDHNVQGSMSQLQDLTMSRLDGDTLQKIVQICPLLHTLSVYFGEFNNGLNNLGVSYTENSLRLINNSSIKTLYLIDCWNLYTADLVGLHKLEKLVLCSAGTRTKLCAQGIVHIHYCSGIDHTVVLKVLRVATQLRDLAFTSHHAPATNPALEMLREVVMQLYPQLHSFQISC